MSMFFASIPSSGHVRKLLSAPADTIRRVQNIMQATDNTYAPEQGAVHALLDAWRRQPDYYSTLSHNIYAQ